MFQKSRRKKCFDGVLILDGVFVLHCLLLSAALWSSDHLVHISERNKARYRSHSYYANLCGIYGRYQWIFQLVQDKIGLLITCMRGLRLHCGRMAMLYATNSFLESWLLVIILWRHMQVTVPKDAQLKEHPSFGNSVARGAISLNMIRSKDSHCRVDRLRGKLFKKYETPKLPHNFQIFGWTLNRLSGRLKDHEPKREPRYWKSTVKPMWCADRGDLDAQIAGYQESHASYCGCCAYEVWEDFPALKMVAVALCDGRHSSEELGTISLMQLCRRRKVTRRVSWRRVRQIRSSDGFSAALPWFTPVYEVLSEPRSLQIRPVPYSIPLACKTRI